MLLRPCSALREPRGTGDSCTAVRGERGEILWFYNIPQILKNFQTNVHFMKYFLM